MSSNTSTNIKLHNASQYTVGAYIYKNERGTDVAQKIQIIEDFCKNLNLNIVDYYIDNYNEEIEFMKRQAITRLMNDLISGKVNMIVIKDIDSLSKDYKKVRQGVQLLLHKNKNKLVSIENDIVITPGSIRLINDKLKKIKFASTVTTITSNTNQKVVIKKVFSAPNTNNVICRPPFGYILKENTKNEFIIDGPAANVVVEIFSKIIEGYSYQKIANNFNERGILTVSQYAEKMGRNPRRISTQWNTSTIYQIATNEIYLGHLVQSNFGRPSFKNRSNGTKTEEKIVYYNAHEPIIDEQTFKLAQNITHGRTKGSTQKILNTRRAPFGYDTDPENNNKFKIDPEAATVVRTIFNRIINGFFYYQIADEFNNKGLLTVSQYESRKGKKQRRISTKWNTSTIYKIVRNEVYLGHLIKIKKIINNETGDVKKEKVIVRNTHDPIITEEEFELVQKAIRNKHAANTSEDEESEKSDVEVEAE